MMDLQYVVFVWRANRVSLKGERQRIGNPQLEFLRSGGAFSIRVGGFMQEPWDFSRDPQDHLDFYVHQDLLDDLEREAQGWAGPVAARQFPAVNPRWSATGATRLFYVFDRSEIPVTDASVLLGAGVHGPCCLRSDSPRLFVDREVPQRGRGFRARVHFGVDGVFQLATPCAGAAADEIVIRMDQNQARMIVAAVQYAIDEHRARNP